MDAVCEPLRVRLLDQRLGVEHGGRVLRLDSPPRVPVLFAYLLLNRDRSVNRDELAFTLWPDENEGDARANLRRHLNYIRSGLPPAPVPWLHTDRKWTRLNHEAPLWIDTREFERLSAMHDGRERAVELYRTDLLAAMDEDFVRPERDRLRSLQVTNLNYLISAERARKNYRGALRYVEQLSTLDEWREDLVRRAMILHFEAGDRAGALAAYDGFVQRLFDEFGAEPMSATQQVYDCIRDGLPMPVADFSVLPAASKVEDTKTLRFVGRDDELLALRTAWTRAARGAGGVVFVSGSAGIGKTRLIQRFAAQALDEGGEAAFGQTSDPERNAFEPVSAALRPFAQTIAAAGINDAYAGALASVLPELDANTPIREPLARLKTDDERRRLFEAVALALIAISNARPLVLVLEDLHRAGQATCDLFSFLARRLVSTPILIVASYRDDEIERTHPLRAARRAVEAAKQGRTISLSPLERPQFHQLIAELSEAPHTARAVADFLYDRSEGNPFFAGEILRDALESGAIRLEHGHWRVIEAPPSMPASLEATIERRFERLSRRARTVAAVCSVIGRTIDVELVAECGGWNEADVSSAVGELTDRKIVREATDEGATLEFSHDLMRETLYAMQDRHELLRRHRRVGDVLESLRGSDPAAAQTLAFHFEHGGDAQRAVRQYGRAAEYSRDIFAHSEATLLATRALALTDDDQQRVPLLLLRALAFETSGERDRELHDLREVLALAEARNDIDAQFEACLRLVRVYRELGRLDEERDALDAAGRIATQTHSPKHSGRVHLERGRSPSFWHERAAIDRELEAAAALLDRSDPAWLEAEVHLCDRARLQGDLPTARLHLRCVSAAAARNDVPSARLLSLRLEVRIAKSEGRHTEARRLATEATELARRVGDRRSECDSFSILAFTLHEMGRLDEAIAAAREATAIADACSFPEISSSGRRVESEALRDLLRYDDALALKRHALQTARTTQNPLEEAIALAELAQLLIMQGSLKEADCIAREAVESAEHVDRGLVGMMARFAHGQILLDAGDTTRGLPLLEAAFAVSAAVAQSEQSAPIAAALGHAYAIAGQKAKAIELSRSVLQIDTRPSGDRGYMFWRASRAAQVAGEVTVWRDLLARGRTCAEPVFKKLGAEDQKSVASVPWIAEVLDHF